MAILHYWRFCPRCATELDLAHAPARVECPNCGFIGYANSSPCACALVEDENGRVLLGRRGIEPELGLWDMLGGYLEEHEHPLDGLARELLEETGMTIEPDRFLGVFMGVYGDLPDAAATLNLVWTAHIVAGEPVAADDVAELRWFAPDELPAEDELAFGPPVDLRRVDGQAMNVVFLFDVDNTLLDNDRVADDLRAHLNDQIGQDCGSRYWELFEELRSELGYADYLGALQRYRIAHPHDPRILIVSQFLITYPFANRLLPGSLDVLDHCATIGLTAILSDGDVVFQPRKIHRSGLYDAVGGRVLVYIHKEQELQDVEARLPADHYVLVDDKVRILAAVKAAWGARVTTVWPRQGHYALDVADVARYPVPDVTIERIGDFVELHEERLVEAAG